MFVADPRRPSKPKKEASHPIAPAVSEREKSAAKAQGAREHGTTLRKRRRQLGSTGERRCKLLRDGSRGRGADGPAEKPLRIEPELALALPDRRLDFD